MARVLSVMVVTAALVVFGAQNWDNVPVQLIFGPPTRVRLVFLIVIAAGIGYVAAVLRGIRREVRLRGEVRQLRKQLGALDAGRRLALAADEAPADELADLARLEAEDA